MDGSVPPRIAGYNVYRSEDPKSFSAVPLNHEPVKNPEFEDRNFEFDKTYFYCVSVVGSRENPYAESLASTSATVVARDTFPPGAPQNLNAVVAGPAVLLLWVPPPQRDVAGYRIYRRLEGEPATPMLQQELVKTPSFRDEKAQQGKTYIYRVTAVDTHGNEGPAAEAAVEVR
jgi:fibronectin type 3 domain-containing protein